MPHESSLLPGLRIDMTIHLARDLQTLHRDLLSMGAKVEQMVHDAVDSLTRPSEASARELAKRDDEIDRWDVQIEEECLKILALHQPVAIDLRRIATVLKISNELERIADLAVHIAERASALERAPRLEITEKLRAMAQAAVGMVHRSIDAYVEMDSRAARQVCEDDADIDVQNREMIQELRRMMRREQELIEPCLHLFSVSRHLERVADHATNIAEDVVYLVEGAIIRHRSPLSGES